MDPLPKVQDLIPELHRHGIALPGGVVRVGAFGDSAELSEELLFLIRRGRKRAGASLVWAHEADAEPIPIIGEECERSRQHQMRRRMTTDVRYLGVGRGPRTRDGCSVELYLRLPYGGEVELIEGRIPEAASVMELGCGVGRVTRELLARGYRVTAVDNSPEMLAHVPPEASRICADIEGLDVGEEFDAVILASCLVNTPDVTLRLAQLTKCRELLKPAGHLLLERFDPAWLAKVHVGPLNNIGTVEMRVDEVHGCGADRELCFSYREGEDEWLQYFTATILDDEDIRQNLSSAGFEAPEWINRRWASARVLKK